MRAVPALPVLAVALTVAACAHHAPEVAAAPAPAPAAPAVTHAAPNADSAARAQRDAERRALAARLAADSNALGAMLHFAFNRSLLTPADTSSLNAKLALLQRYPQLRIEIAGNCDDRGSDAYNLALGEQRAAAAKRYLVFYGIDPHRIDIISYGSERPVSTGDTDASWAMNRNDEFVALTTLNANH